MNLTFHRLESVFNITTSSFFSNRQHLDESVKVLVDFALALNTAMLADGLWAIKITNLIAGPKTFLEFRGGSRPVYKVCTNLSEFFPKIFLRVYIVKCK